MKLCSRCWEAEGVIIHNTRVRKDGSKYHTYYCRNCQRKRVNRWKYEKLQEAKA